MEPSSAGQGKWRRQSERRTPNCRSDKTTIQRNDVPRGTMDETSSLWTLVSIALPRSVREVRLFRLFLLIPCWESQRLIPKRSAGPRASRFAAFRERDSAKLGRMRLAPSSKVIDVFEGSMLRKFEWKVIVAICAIDAASSTPVGPAPTRSKRARSAGSSVSSAFS